MTGRSSFGNIRRRAETGRWQARWQDAGGGSHSRTFDTKREAAVWLAAEETDQQRGTWTDPQHGKETFRSFSDRWRGSVVDLRQSTQDRDLGYLDWYLLPAFGELALADVDHMAVRAWVASMNNRYQPATVVKAAQILSKIMETSVKAHLLAVNPCKGVDLPAVELVEMRFLTADQLALLADTIDPRFRAAVLLAGYCGLRSGELFGLRVRSVNPLRRQVHVVEQVVESSGRLYYGPPKTKAGRRTVPVPSSVMDAVAAHLGGPPDSLVFPSPQGCTVRRSSWRTRFWLPAVEAAGFEGLRMHDLRHTAVALWIDAGASALSIARRAGHKSVAVVLDRYGHVFPEAEDGITERLDRMAVLAQGGG